MTENKTPLPHSHLFTLRLVVDAANVVQIGETPEGRRSVAPIIGGTFEGERLRGTVLPGGADWVRFRPDGTMMIDVRLTLKSDDGAMIYMTYEGRFIGGSTAMAELSQGKKLEPKSYSLVTTIKFECGNPTYAWLNNVVAVGVGTQSGFNPVYTVFEIG